MRLQKSLRDWADTPLLLNSQLYMYRHTYRCSCWIWPLVCATTTFHRQRTYAHKVQQMQLQTAEKKLFCFILSWSISQAIELFYLCSKTDEYSQLSTASNDNKNDGYQDASVSAISLRHILASHGYAPGTIAVNVTWKKKRIQCLSNV